MLLYHATSGEAADRIIREGFLDGTGNYLTSREYTGVWLSDVPEFYTLGAEALLEVDLRVAADAIAAYEWVNEGSVGYREFLIPAAIVNAQSTVRVVSEDEFWERKERGDWR